ncbi:hypothetical protein ACJX0J_006886, partial [Zea mays]
MDVLGRMVTAAEGAVLLQPLATRSLPGWKADLMTRAGRTVQVRIDGFKDRGTMQEAITGRAWMPNTIWTAYSFPGLCYGFSPLNLSDAIIY